MEGSSLLIKDNLCTRIILMVYVMQSQNNRILTQFFNDSNYAYLRQIDLAVSWKKGEFVNSG